MTEPMTPERIAEFERLMSGGRRTFGPRHIREFIVALKASEAKVARIANGRVCACRFDEAEENILQWCGLHGEVRDALKAAEAELARYKAVYTAAEALNFTEFAGDGRYTIDANPEALDALGVALRKDTDDG